MQALVPVHGAARDLQPRDRSACLGAAARGADRALDRRRAVRVRGVCSTMASAPLLLLAAVVATLHAAESAPAGGAAGGEPGIRWWRASASSVATSRCWARCCSISSPTLAGGVNALLPIYARDILDVGAWGVGVLRSATALGALIARRRPLALPGRARRRAMDVRRFRALRASQPLCSACRQNLDPVACCADGDRHERHDQLGGAPDPDPDAHARRDARAGLGRQCAVLRHRGPARRLPRRRDGGVRSARSDRSWSAASR